MKHQKEVGLLTEEAKTSLSEEHINNYKLTKVGEALLTKGKNNPSEHESEKPNVQTN